MTSADDGGHQLADRGGAVRVLARVELDEAIERLVELDLGLLEVDHVLRDHVGGVPFVPLVELAADRLGLPEFVDDVSLGGFEGGRLRSSAHVHHFPSVGTALAGGQDQVVEVARDPLVVGQFGVLVMSRDDAALQRLLDGLERSGPLAGGGELGPRL